MDRAASPPESVETLAALEKRVDALRVVAAEKAVLARSLAYGDPPRFHAEISTAILALAVFVVFLLGREAGILTAKGTPCAGVARGEYAWVSFVSGDFDVILDTKGNLWRNRTWERRVPASAVREIADQLARGCFLEKQPAFTYSNAASWSTMSLNVGNRFSRYSYVRTGPMPLCGGHDDMSQIERAIRNVADQEHGR